MIFLGVDPGKSGGIATLREDGRVSRVDKMPDTNRDLLELLVAITEGGTRRAHAIVERLHMWRDNPMGKAGVFEFGRSYGALEMGLEAAGVAYDQVQPARWQSAMGCLTRGDKKISYRRAQQLFPRVTVTHAIADALLIAEFGRRVSRGQIQPTAPRSER